MKRILVMCKDRGQWESYQSDLAEIANHSLCYSSEVRDNSVLVFEYGEPFSVFIMFTPNTSEDIARMFLFDSIKWLCDEREFDKEIVNYLKGRINDELC